MFGESLSDPPFRVKLFQDRRRRPLGAGSPAFQPDHPVSQTNDLRPVRGDDDGRHAAQFLDGTQQGLLAVRVQMAFRPVEQQQTAAANIAASQRDTLQESRLRIVVDQPHIDGQAKPPIATDTRFQYADVLHHAREVAGGLDIRLRGDRVHQPQIVLDAERQKFRQFRHIGDGLAQLHGIEQARFNTVQTGVTGGGGLQPRQHPQQR